MEVAATPPKVHEHETAILVIQKIRTLVAQLPKRAAVPGGIARKHASVEHFETSYHLLSAVLVRPAVCDTNTE